MEQSEFGKRVFDARLQKGLTQKELADACKVDIRTIQRIEAGEVMPRMYTVKLLTQVLNFTFEEVSENSTAILTERNSILNLAFVFGIIFITNNILYNILESRISSGHGSQSLFYLWIGLSLIHIVAILFFLRGWFYLGSFYKVRTLKFSAILIGILVPVYVLSSFMSFSSGMNGYIQFAWMLIFFFGFAAIFAGVGLLRLKVKSKVLAELGGVLQIVCGLFFLVPVDISRFMGMMLTFPANILILILIYKERRAID